MSKPSLFIQLNLLGEIESESPFTYHFSESLLPFFEDVAPEERPLINLARALLNSAFDDVCTGLVICEDAADNGIVISDRERKLKLNYMLDAFDWLNEEPQGRLDFVNVISSLGINPQKAREVFAERVEEEIGVSIKTAGRLHILRMPESVYITGRLIKKAQETNKAQAQRKIKDDSQEVFEKAVSTRYELSNVAKAQPALFHVVNKWMKLPGNSLALERAERFNVYTPAPETIPSFLDQGKAPKTWPARSTRQVRFGFKPDGSRYIKTDVWGAK